jgi:peptidyl-prolyl cis-trans isomerase B (cyclophilin B)
MRTHGKPVSLFLLVVLVPFLWTTGCGSKDGSPPAASIDAVDSGDPSATDGKSAFALTEPVQLNAEGTSTETPAQPRVEPQRPPQVLINTSLGDIRVELDAEKAPVTVDNFLANYVDRGFYDNTVVHYVEKDFMILGGGYTTELEPKETRAYIRNEADNGLKNLRGTIAMSRHPEHIDSATSQFYINLVDNPSLDHKSPETSDDYGYCVFGKVTDGMDVVDRIAGVEVEDRGQFASTPVQPVVIKSIQRDQ